MKSNSFEVNVINQRLEHLYGKSLISERANFRVVWSEDQFERRDVEGDSYTEGGLFLGKRSSVETVPKYDYLDNQFVVERLHDNTHPDVLEGSQVYEPLFAFPKGLPIKWEAIDIVVKHALRIIPPENIPKTEAQALSLDDTKKQEEKKRARAFLDQLTDSSVEMSLHEKNAISLSGTGHKDESDSRQHSAIQITGE